MILRVMKNVGPIANSSTNKQFVNDTGLEKTYADLHVVVFCFISILYRLYIYIYIDLSTLQEAKPLSSCFHQPHRHSTTELLWLMAPNGRIQCHLPFSKSQCGGYIYLENMLSRVTEMWVWDAIRYTTLTIDPTKAYKGTQWTTMALECLLEGFGVLVLKAHSYGYWNSETSHFDTLVSVREIDQSTQPGPMDGFFKMQIHVGVC